MSFARLSFIFGFFGGGGGGGGGGGAAPVITARVIDLGAGRALLTAVAKTSLHILMNRLVSVALVLMRLCIDLFISASVLFTRLPFTSFVIRTPICLALTLMSELIVIYLEI
jgi:hypothetical protein